MGVRFGVRVTHQPRKPLLYSQLEVVAGGRIGQITPLLHPKHSRFHWLFNIIRHNPTIPILTRLVSVSLSVRHES